MNNLVIAVFNDRLKAEEVRIALRKKQAEHLFELEDSAVLERREDGKVKLHHVTHFTIEGALGGGFLGALLGIMLLNPVFAVLGTAAGTVLGGVSGSMSHAGVDEDFMQDLAKHLKPGTSALCAIVADHLDKVIEEIRRFDGKIIRTPLRHTDEKKLAASLEYIKTQVTA